MTITYLRTMLERSDKPTIILLREKVKAALAEAANVEASHARLAQLCEDLTAKNNELRTRTPEPPSVSFPPPAMPEPPPPVIDDKELVKAVTRAYELHGGKPPASAVVEEMRKALEKMK